MQNLILFHTDANSDGEFMSQAHQKLKNKENLIRADEMSFEKIKIFLIKKFVVKVEEEKEAMRNWIFFQTVANSGGEFGSEQQKKLKNKENLIHANELSFDKIKIFLMRNSSSEYKKKRRRCGIQLSFKLSQIQIKNLCLNRTRNWKIRKI